ncbi:MAG: hypothetical protein WA639_06090 [Candidatus Acidiferrum sp.]
MSQIVRYPQLVFALGFLVLWISAQVGAFFRKRRGNPEIAEREDFGVVVSASLTLLALIIGFSFSMASSRYDARKTLEASEANAVATEYARADFLPPTDAETVRTLLRNYLEQRVLFYETRDSRQLQRIGVDTVQLENELWTAVQGPAAAETTPVIALAVSGMNEVLSSRGYAQAAWLNRIPITAWVLMTAIAVCCNVLIGYGARRGEAKAGLLLVLPLIVSISFSLIANIDSPRGGLVRVYPQNLVSLSHSLHPH